MPADGSRNDVPQLAIQNNLWHHQLRDLWDGWQGGFSGGWFDDEVDKVRALWFGLRNELK